MPLEMCSKNAWRTSLSITWVKNHILMLLYMRMRLQWRTIHEGTRSVATMPPLRVAASRVSGHHLRHSTKKGRPIHIDCLENSVGVLKKL